jgi:rhodanese-related sulfurtransferase
MTGIATILVAGMLILAGAYSRHGEQATVQAPPTRSEAGSAFKAKKLTRAEFDALRANPSHLLVLDVRRPDELTSIGGFGTYLSIQASELEKSLAWIPRDRSIVTVSNHAARAGRAADLLAKNGFTVAGAIGAQDYEAEGGTLVKIAPPAPRPASN